MVVQKQVRLCARVLYVDAGIEGDIVEVGKDMPKQSGLAHLSRPADHHDRERLDQLPEFVRDASLNVHTLQFDGAIIKLQGAETRQSKYSGDLAKSRFAAALTLREGIRPRFFAARP